MEGRFISKDPIGFKGGVNAYAYVQNNPVNAIDPFGLDSCAERDQCIRNAENARKICTTSFWAAEGGCVAACAAGCTLVPGYLECFLPCVSGCHGVFGAQRKICWVLFIAELHSCYKIKCPSKCHIN